jgi:hypothetical protein
MRAAACAQVGLTEADVVIDHDLAPSVRTSLVSKNRSLGQRRASVVNKVWG